MDSVSSLFIYFQAPADTSLTAGETEGESLIGVSIVVLVRVSEAPARTPKNAAARRSQLQGKKF